ncbi:MAG: hypothetical protein ACTHLR_09450 [Rhizomicrobium sp.]
MNRRRTKRQIRRLIRFVQSDIIMAFGTMFLAGYTLAHTIISKIK